MTQPSDRCEECGEQTRRCDECDAILHLDDTKIWKGGGVYCSDCHRKHTGRCYGGRYADND